MIIEKYYTFRFSLVEDERILEGGRVVTEDRHTIIDKAVGARDNEEEIKRARIEMFDAMDSFVPTATKQEPETPDTLPHTQPTPEPEATGKPEGVRGLLRLRCPKCGRVFGTFLRDYQTEVVCNCGHHIDLTAPLAGYRFTCPYCEKETWGKTNLEDPEITVRCKCGGDINLQWDTSAREYRN